MAPHDMLRDFAGAAALVLGWLVAASLGGCGDEVPDPRGQAHAGKATAAHTVKWLDLSSPITPAQWLASRGESKPRPLDDPEVRRLGELLASADRRYQESERMIANRAAQLSDMLASLGIDESPTDILADLATLADDAGQTEGFGAVGQHYFNLRSARVTRADALSTLKTRYGRRS